MASDHPGVASSDSCMRARDAPYQFTSKLFACATVCGMRVSPSQITEEAQQADVHMRTRQHEDVLSMSLLTVVGT